MSKNKLAQVFHFDLYGKRDVKYDFLNENSLKSIEWNELSPHDPNYFFSEKNFGEIEEYKTWININELFNFSASGMVGGRDSLVVNFKNDFSNIINNFKSLEISVLNNIYKLKESRDWKLENAISDIKNNSGKVIKTAYKALDERYTYYTGKTKGFVQYPRKELVQHFIKDNLGLALMRNIIPNDKFSQVFITKSIIDKNYYSFQSYLFPLYLYPEINSQQSTEETQERIPNLNMNIVHQIAKGLGLTFVPELENGNVCFANNNEDLRDDFKQTFAPIELLDYIYAVLHSPTYREQYKEFLKIDFPRVPYPKDATTFWHLVKLGGQIREIHLLESPVVENYITQYPEDGDNVVTKPVYKNGNVYINDTQYFSNVPEVAWNFYIGGYQPAQKWLKDRKERVLDFEDILHYQKIIVALSETDRLMKEIDQVEI